MTGERLNLRQAAAVELLTSGEVLTAAEVARRSGYSDAPDVAKVQGHRLITNANVISAVAERRLSLAAQAGITPLKLLRRIDKRARNPLTPAATAQRADEYLGDVVQLREQQAANVDARSLTLIASSDDVKDLARMILGDL